MRRDDGPLPRPHYSEQHVKLMAQGAIEKFKKQSNHRIGSHPPVAKSYEYPHRPSLTQVLVCTKAVVKRLTEPKPTVY